MICSITLSEVVLGSVFVALALQRGLELRHAKRNEVWARERGAVEHGADHYLLFFVLHIGWQIGWVAEAWWRGPALDPAWPAWTAVLVTAQCLRYWAIHALGPRWNTRILVIPEAKPVTRGPYRFLRHPNYVAVVLELVAIPMLFGAMLTAAIATALNLILLLGIRIPAENRALGRSG